MMNVCCKVVWKILVYYIDMYNAHYLICFYFTFLIGIKKYIVNVIIKLSSTPESLDREKVYLNKLNMILVQVSVCLILRCPE